MALTGVTSIGAITRDILVQEESSGRTGHCPVCGN
jgi:hypothetical protein